VDRLGRDLLHLVNLVYELTKRNSGLRVLAGEGASIDTTTANGRPVFGMFAALAEFERALKAGLGAARACGRNGGRHFKMMPAKLRLARAAMGQPETKSPIFAPSSSPDRLCIDLLAVKANCEPMANCSPVPSAESKRSSFGVMALVHDVAQEPLRAVVLGSVEERL
jgi:hypothetical protein